MLQECTKPPCFIFLNDKGGVGKTLSCHVMALALLDRGDPLRIVECEKQGRLKGIFPSFVDFHPLDAEETPSEADSAGRTAGYWDRVVASIARTDGGEAGAGPGPRAYLLDLGAGFTSPFLRWAENGGAARLLEVVDPVFLMVATINRDSLEIGFENLLQAGRLFPEMRRVVVQNGRDGDFRQWSGTYEAARDAINRAGREIEEVVFPGCFAPHWAYFQNMGRLDQVAVMDARQFARTIEKPTGVAANSLFVLTRWLQQAMRTFDGILHDKLSDQSGHSVRFPFHRTGGSWDDSGGAGRGGAAA